MKVLHINTSNAGGAAKAVIRLHLALLKSGIESDFLYLNAEEKLNIRNSYQFPKFYPSFLQRMMRKFGLIKFRNEKVSDLYRDAEGDFDSISYFESDYEVHKHRLFQEADIINLHWVGNFIDYPSFFKNCNKPIVWTLHDKNPAMGCLHLLSDCTRNNNLKEVEAGIAKVKSQILRELKNLYIVAPSKALMDYSKSSSALQKHPHFCILNSIDSVIYKELPNNSVKEILGLPSGKKNVLIFIHPLNVFHKGIDLFFDIFLKYEFKNIHFLFVGSFDSSVQTKNTFTVLPYIHDELLLSIIYSAADILVITSREENLPNVMLESMSCGTPVLSFPVGGMLDVIKHRVNGLLAESVSSDSLGQILEELNDGKYKFDRKRIREFAVENFSSAVQAKKYIELYKSVLE